MSRRNKIPKAIYTPQRGMPTDEWKIRNYLFKNDIYANSELMQTVIMNSFCTERVEDELEWKERIAYIHKHFGSFAMYAQNNWKHDHTVLETRANINNIK